MKKVIFAFSGDLGSAVCLHYLRNVRGFKVITFYAKFSESDVHDLLIKAVQMGSEAAHVVDLTDKFIDEYVRKAIKAHILYEDYFLSIALSRPMIMQEMLKIAKEEKCEYVSHGAHISGNDYIRFRNLITSLDHKFRIISPLQELGLMTPGEVRKYALSEQIYSFDEKIIEKNIWGNSWKLDRSKEISKYVDGVHASRGQKQTKIVLGFHNGLPISINGVNKSLKGLIHELNEISKPYGIGNKVTAEDVLKGTKELYFYSAPSAEIIYNSVSTFESYVFDKMTLDIRRSMSSHYSQIIYEGRWFLPVRDAMDKFFDKTSRRITGNVTLRLAKDSVRVIDIDSRYSMV